MAQTKTKGGPAKVRTRKVDIELPEGFYDFLEKVCKTQGISADDYVVNSVIDVLGGDLETDLGYHLGLGLTLGPKYRNHVESLARPEEKAEEA